MTLLERGIIPKDVDLTPAFEKGAPPVAVKSMRFHDKAEMHIKHDVHTERFNKNTLKFDMQHAKLKPIKELPPSDENNMALVPYEGPGAVTSKIVGTQSAELSPTVTASRSKAPSPTGERSTDRKVRGYD